MKGYPTYATSQAYLDQVAELLGELPEQSDRFIDSLYAAFEAGQTVFHLHLHVIGGRPLSWPPG